MSIDTIGELLGWCTIINYSLLILWFLFFVLAHDFLFKLHGKWFNLTVERFDAMHYVGMAVFKVFIFVFNLTPYLAIQLVY